MSAPLVSVCVPTYNNQRHLAECLSSIQAQNFANFEVVVLDDCSSDGTLDIALEFSRSDSRIRVVQNESNRGLPGNWNEVARLSTGTWVKFVFGDDKLSPHCLGRMVEYVGVGIPFIFSRRLLLEDTSDPGPTGLVQYLRGHREKLAKLYPYSATLFPRSMTQIALTYFGENIIGEPTSVLIRRDAFDRFGYFDDRFRQLCDMEYWARVTTNTGAIAVAEDLSWFRVHGNSTSARTQIVGLEAIQRAEMALLAYKALVDPAYSSLRSIAGDGVLQGLRGLQLQLVDDFKAGRTEIPGEPRLRAVIERFISEST